MDSHFRTCAALAFNFIAIPCGEIKEVLILRRLLLSLLPVILIAIVSAGSIGACISGGMCNLNFNNLTNGSSAGAQDSEWSFKNGNVEVFTIAFFVGGAGTRLDAGDFTWE